MTCFEATKMDQSEWETLDAIRKELNSNLMAYDWMAQEKFTELLVKSLEGKGDQPPRAVSRPT
jgi:hypothetical protein